MNIICYDMDRRVIKQFYQWDLNQKIIMHGVPIDDLPMFHFCNRLSKEALVVSPTILGEDVVVDVPNILLQQSDSIIIYLYDDTDGNGFRTIHSIHIPVAPRPKPSDYEYEDNIVAKGDIFWAAYGVTTYDEIRTAQSLDKFVRMEYEDLIYNLDYIDAGYAKFVHIGDEFDSELSYASITVSFDDEWTVNDVKKFVSENDIAKLDEDINGYDAIQKKEDYLYEAWYSKINYDDAIEYYKNTESPFPTGACSSVRNGNFVGRNLDWKYNQECEFIVHTPRVANRYASIGMSGGFSKLTQAFVESGEYDPAYKIVPFQLLDGINEYGVYANANVVPTDLGYNKVVPTEESEVEISAFMLIRYILDSFRTAEDAVDYIQHHVTIFFPKSFHDVNYELHFMVADKSKTFLLEFIDNATVVTDMTDGAESYLAGKPYMTNYLLYGVTFNEDGTVNTPENGGSPTTHNGITEHGSGLERYNYIVENYESANTSEGMHTLMNALKYTRTYETSEDPSDPFWYTEYVGGSLSVDSSVEDFADIVTRYGQKFLERSRDDVDMVTWQTVHSAIYNIASKTMSIVAQEGAAEYTISNSTVDASLSEAGMAADAKAVGDILNNKADDDGVVHKDGNETITGTKSFRSNGGFVTRGASISAYGLSVFNDSPSAVTSYGASMIATNYVDIQFPANRPGLPDTVTMATTDDIPSTLPNPNAITFTGAATGTYDGSAAMTINIPQGGSGGAVDSVNGQTGVVTLDADDVGAISNDGDAGQVPMSDGDGGTDWVAVVETVDSLDSARGDAVYITGEEDVDELANALRDYQIKRKTIKIVNINTDDGETEAPYGNISSDSSVIITPTRNILIDIGRELDYQKIKTSLLANGVRRLDYIFFTHYHHDHCGCSAYDNNTSISTLWADEDIDTTNTVLILPYPADPDNPSSGAVLYSADEKNGYEKVYASLAAVISSNNIVSSLPQEGKYWDVEASVLGEAPVWVSSKPTADIVIRALNCSADKWAIYQSATPTGTSYYNARTYNNYSTVLELEYGYTLYTFTGDINYTAEAANMNEMRQTDILKIGHHTGNSEYTEAYWRKMNPRWAIINCDHNVFAEYGEYLNSDRPAIAWMTSQKIPMYFLSESGDVIWESDGRKYELVNNARNQIPSKENVGLATELWTGVCSVGGTIDMSGTGWKNFTLFKVLFDSNGTGAFGTLVRTSATNEYFRGIGGTASTTGTMYNITVGFSFTVSGDTITLAGTSNEQHYNTATSSKWHNVTANPDVVGIYGVI